MLNYKTIYICYPYGFSSINFIGSGVVDRMKNKKTPLCKL